MSRRSDLDKGSVTGGLVNEAYNDVKKVADSIDEVRHVADNLGVLTTYSVTLQEAVGDNTLSGDMDATDWTGNEHTDDQVVTALSVDTTQNLLILYKGVIYAYHGVKPTLLGLGGKGTTMGDYSIVGTVDNLSGLIQFPAGDTTDPVLAEIAVRKNMFLTFDINGGLSYSPGTVTSYLSTITDTNLNHDLILTDDGNLIAMDNAAANTVTVPLDATVDFRLGTQILVTQEGLGVTTIAAEGGVILQSAGGKLAIANQFTAVSLIKKAADTWQVVGDMV